MPVLVDLYGVVSLADVAVRFERAYAKELRGAIRGRVEEFLQKTGLGLSLGAFGISARLQLEPKTDPLPALHALLDLPLRLEESGGFRAYIALDEFQDVRKVPSLDGLLRSHIQFQGEVASYVFAGSEPGLMSSCSSTRRRRFTARRCRSGSAACATTISPGTSPSASARASARSARRSTRCSPRRRAIRSARCCSRTGSGKRSSRAHGDAGGLGASAHRGARGAAAGIRGAVARARHLGAEDAASDHRGRRLSLPRGGARAARADEAERRRRYSG